MKGKYLGSRNNDATNKGLTGFKLNLCKKGMRVGWREGRKRTKGQGKTLTDRPLLVGSGGEGGVIYLFPSQIFQMVVQSFLEEDREDHDKEMEEQMMLKEVCVHCVYIGPLSSMLYLIL